MPQNKTKLLDRVRNSLRQRNYAYSTEQSYTNWIKRYILFHDKKHPLKMGEKEIEEYLKASEIPFESKFNAPNIRTKTTCKEAMAVSTFPTLLKENTPTPTKNRPALS